MRSAVRRVARPLLRMREAMRYGLLTDPRSISEESRRRLAPVAGRYCERRGQ